MNTSYTLRIALIVSLGGFLYGFDASVISGVIGYVGTQYNLTAIQQGWVVSSPTFAAMFSMLTAGTISTKFGRRKVLLFVAILYAISAIGSAIAPTYETLVISRMIGGLAFGAALILAPLYIAEISPAEKRGRLVSIQQLNLVIGLSAAYFSNYFLQIGMEGSSLLNETNIWRWMLGVEAIPAILYFIFLFFVPRSPRWLLLKGKSEEAETVLSKILEPEKALSEKVSIVESIKEQDRQPNAGLPGLFKKNMRLVLLIGLIIGIVQMITGINAIFFYANSIFEQSGVGTNAAFAQAVLVGITFIVFTVISMMIIDRFGRKPLLLIGLIGVILSLGITTYGFQQATFKLTKGSITALNEDFDASPLSALSDQVFNSDLSYKKAVIEQIGRETFGLHQNKIIEAAINIESVMVLVGILGFIASFALSLGPVMWVLLSEIFPTKIRGMAISVIGFVNSSTSTIVTLVFPWELENLGNVTTFLIYIVFAAIGFVLLAKLLPETKGKSLEELEMELVK